MPDAIKKSEVIIFRVTPDQKETFKRSCERMGFNQSEHLRSIIDITEPLSKVFARPKDISIGVK